MKGLTRIHHIGVAVTDLDESIELYRRAFGGELIHRATSEREGLEAAFMRTGSGEVELIDAAPRPGMHGGRIAFLHPKSVGGVLTELVEP